MLLQRLKCPQGCANSVLTESRKTVSTGPSNLLLDNNHDGITPQKTEVIKVYTCQCCGNSFEMHENKSDSRMVL